MAESLGMPLRTWEDWEAGRRSMPDYNLRMLTFYVMSTFKKVNNSHTVNIVHDENGNAIVIINDIRFKGRQNIDWHSVEEYLYEYVGENVEIIESADIVYIGNDFPKEVKGSEDTRRLRGTNAKAKANAVQGLPELIEIADGKKFTENYKEKHTIDAMYGWYRYESRFALPVFNEVGEIERYNVFNVIMVI